MQPLERVYVRTRDFEGRATVLHIIQNEFYPVQVELDKPDEDGHRIKRVAFHEIIKETTSYKPSLSTPVIESKRPEMQQQMTFFDLL
ncbi:MULTISPECIES: hypothetical protein [unclassified Planococcus (in: firmicutes)]|uniref:hypothetical protein n=1 Tax=Planococcus TaxID=1372 RepID=UPI000C31F101|nr:MULTISPECIES: hypothetical protein [unclassified Planococcus (in: firmicutes)]AUD12379.1 hypothetical protein CW734_00435 [Planococcus sp. MB-3u-03]PKG46536.1 hypothetical protein CXF66_06575 [Planococcus sp. Urea-trap-24]PKG89778.1 hypothetical protein CXF91_06230 [Planococcus sp. Urea-3u-39]PKH40819.1 hypothetical protein CXF77_07165 [Planococcus sp. MB-3u-09]